MPKLGIGSSLTRAGLTTPGIVTDSLVLKHNYAAGGVVPVSDGAAYFDGTDDYIDTGNSFQSTFRADFSIAFWMKAVDGQPGSQEILFGMRDSGATDSNILVLEADGTFTWTYRCDNGTESTATSSVVFADDGVTDWTHIALTTDDGNDDMYLYVNGVSVALDDDLSGVTMSDFTLSETFYIGAQNNAGSSANWFDGYICNVGIWSAALTQAQIKSIMWKNYADLTTSETTNLVSWWNLSADANDNHGSNDGTLS